MSAIYRAVFTLLLGAGLFTPAFAQEELFAFVDNPKSAGTTPQPLGDHKYQTAKELYDRLIRARGDARMPAPEFVMNTGDDYIAWMHPGKNQIGLEEKAYDVCVQLGPDSLTALAMLLSHEIIHYYENHGWRRNFLNNKTRSTNAKESFEIESEADYLGGILAISAGFNTYAVLDTFLRLAYTSYGLPEEITGYPSLPQRLEGARTTADSLRKLHTVYQTANLLTLIEAHDLANQYYEYILEDYQGYEVYNNAGVNACLAALQLTPPADMPFVLPLELDLNSRLDHLNTRGLEDAEKRKKELLRDAEDWFTKAMKMAPAESAAYLNLSVLFALQQEWRDATYWAGRALALSRQAMSLKQAADAQIMLGVIAGMQEDKQEATAQFTMAMPGNAPLAKLNLSILEGSREQAAPAPAPAGGIETIEDLDLEEYLSDPQTNVIAGLPGEVYCGKKILEQSELLLHYIREPLQYVLFHQTAPAYTGRTHAQIRLGDDRESILRAYGSAGKDLQLTNGSCLLYPERKILFVLNEQHLLQRWVVYLTSDQP